MEDEIMEITEEQTVTEEPEESTWPEGQEEAAEQPEEQQPPEPEQPEQPDPVLEELKAAKEEAEKKASEFEEQLRRQNALLGRASDGEDPALDVVSQAIGMEPEELLAAVKEELESEQLESEHKALKEEVERLRLEKAMEADLLEVQKADPSVKNLADLGDAYFQCISAGMSATEAYHASKYIAQKTTPTPPAEIGKLNESSVQKDFYTKEEVEAMTAEEVEKNLPKIEQSMKKWS